MLKPTMGSIRHMTANATGARHGEDLREAAGRHNVVNDIMVSHILRRMAEMYNKKHDSEKKQRIARNTKDVSISFIRTKPEEPRC